MVVVVVPAAVVVRVVDRVERSVGEARVVVLSGVGGARLGVTGVVVVVARLGVIGVVRAVVRLGVIGVVSVEVRLGVIGGALAVARVVLAVSGEETTTKSGRRRPREAAWRWTATARGLDTALVR